MTTPEIELGSIAYREIIKRYPYAKVEVELLDLKSLASIQNFARRDYAKSPMKLDLLILNAGPFSMNYVETSDGIEMIWATSVVARHALVQVLLPSLLASKGRVVSVASSVHRTVGEEQVIARNHSQYDFGPFGTCMSIQSSV
jgi:NAD(P)-dependent dehydrogenase (short-subunit alcohol dehydrogenase family)